MTYKITYQNKNGNLSAMYVNANSLIQAERIFKTSKKNVIVSVIGWGCK